MAKMSTKGCSSDLFHILSNLRAVQSASQSVEKNIPNVQKEGRVEGVLNNVEKKL